MRTFWPERSFLLGPHCVAFIPASVPWFIALALSLLTGCFQIPFETRARTFLQADHLLFAHRGASGRARENSRAAFDLARQEGADVLEIDLRLSKDQKAVVIHDDSLKRTHGIDQKVREMNAADLAAQDILDLRAMLRRYRGRINMEIKDRNFRLADATWLAIREARAEERVLVGSFDRSVLAYFRHISGQRVASSASAGEVLEFLLYCKTGYRPSFTRRQSGGPATLPFDALQLPARGLIDFSQSSFMSCAHESGLAVHFWTVNDPFHMVQLHLAGADGIMTDFPDLGKQVGALITRVKNTH